MRFVGFTQLRQKLSRRNMSSSTGSRSILRKFMSRTSPPTSPPLEASTWHSSPPGKPATSTFLVRGADPDCDEEVTRAIRFYSSNHEANLDWVASNPGNEIQEEHLHRDLSLELLQQSPSTRSNSTFSWMPSVPNRRLRQAVSTLKRRNSTLTSTRSNGNAFFSAMYEDEGDESRIGASEDEWDFEDGAVEAIFPTEELTDWTLFSATSWGDQSRTTRSRT
ncbi:hypothetical protein V1505DRAFT_228517 [Lipomyces doorenjongii]|uniref:uncharacterized protein n=1 Tax=Lipomyces doorenjongii TaxID=383834 RepID=UPI00334345FE